MPTPTYTPLATTTLAGTASSVTFSSIPATYRDLVLVVQARADTDTINLVARFNSDTGNNYNHVLMYGDGSAAASFSSANRANIQIAVGSGTTTNAINTITSVLDYSATNKHKSTISKGDEPAFTSAGAGRWANTAAITSFQVYTTTVNNFAIGSTFSLYGIIS
jgi:hypothetical protein